MLSLFFSCSDNEKAFMDPGISRELANFRKNRIENIVYDIHFDIPLHRSEPIEGKVAIKFGLKSTAHDLILNFNAPAGNIKNIIVNGNTVQAVWRLEHLIIPAEVLRKFNTVKINFQAGEQSLNRHEEYLYTLFVPERASTCFPLFDQPNLKASYRLSLTVPSSWNAVANSEVKSLDQRDGKTKYVFAETKPISSYLFSFAAGDFKVITREIEGRVMHMFHRETDSAKLANNVDVIFDWHARSLDWMEAYTGIQYPFEKFDFVLIPSFQYSGMEHPGAILYNASSLLLDKSSTLNEKLNRARLIAHETAHMWFGDLVTMKWFDDVWLKEVFANLMAAKIVNPGFPDVNHDLQFLMAHYPPAYGVDRTRGTHPIQQPLANLKSAGTLYGSIIYEKAPIVMRMLEESVGKEAFRNSIRTYLEKYAFANASWDDLITQLAKNAPFNVNLWNKQWVRSGGMPMVTYTLKSKDEKTIDGLNIWSGNIHGDDRHEWRQDLQVVLGYSDTSYWVAAKLLTAPGAFNISAMPFPRYLFLNANGKGYGYFKMRRGSKQHFLKNIDHISRPVSRAALWINFYEAMLRGDLSPEVLMNRCMESLLQEREGLIAEYITRVIETIYWKFYTPEQRTRLAPRLEGLLLNMALNAHSVSLKSTYFNALKSIAISDHGVLILEKIWHEETAFDGFPLSENDLTELAYELAVREVEGYKDILRKQRERITNPDRRKKYDFILPALSADTSVRDSFFESLKVPENRENEAWVLEALSYLHHPLRAQTAVKYIVPSLEMLKEIQLTGDIFFPKGWLDNTLNGHSSARAGKMVRQFLYRHNDYPLNLKNKILQSADLLFRSVRIKERNSHVVSSNSDPLR